MSVFGFLPVENCSKKRILKSVKKVTYKNVRKWRFLTAFYIFCGAFAIFKPVKKH